MNPKELYEALQNGTKLTTAQKDEVFRLINVVHGFFKGTIDFQNPENSDIENLDFRHLDKIKLFLVKFKYNDGTGHVWYEYWAPDWSTVKRGIEKDAEVWNYFIMTGEKKLANIA